MSELIDNRAHRIRTLKHIIKHLHEGKAPEEVRRQLAELVKETDASEIAEMEQELMAEGMTVQEIQSMCDLHSQVTRDILAEPPGGDLAPGHPVETFRRENAALLEKVAALRGALNAVAVADGGTVTAEQLLPLRVHVGELMDVEKHYARKENLLFPYLESHNITGPSKVMWGKDDEVRELLKALDEALGAGALEAAEWGTVREAVAEPALEAVAEMVYKEERILLPMSLNALTETEWGEIWRQSPEYGWCLVEPGTDYRPPEAAGGPPAAEIPQDRSLRFETGSLTFEQLQGILGVLPVDLTFVDAEDRVRYFSHGPDRVFARSKAILGRKVQHCHPPKSVNIVEQIVNDFRSGRQSVAEFWIEMHGTFVHIRYFAVRGESGEYLGTLEVTQNLTRLRALEGERRLLQYDTPNA